MKKLALLIVPPLLISALATSSQPLEVQAFCNLIPPDRVRVFDWSSWQTVYTRDLNLAYEPFRWDASRNIWNGYQSDPPTSQPADAYKHWTVYFIQPDGTQQWIYILDSRSTPDTDYIWVFDKTEPSTDRNGEHYGTHSCRAFATDSTMINDWLNRVYHPSAN